MCRISKDSVTPNAQRLREQLEFYHRSTLDRRADFIGLLVLNIAYDTSGKDGPDQNFWRAELLEKLRLIYESATERLSKDAWETGNLDLCLMSDEIKRLYNAIPDKIFRRNKQTPIEKTKSVPTQKQTKKTANMTTAKQSNISLHSQVPVTRQAKTINKTAVPKNRQQQIARSKSERTVKRDQAKKE